MNEETILEVQHLSKSYGPFEAVKDVSFSVGRGQVLGFLGPNGAGKTTIMKILTGFHFPTAGTALVEGLSVEDYPLEVKRRIGYLPENVPVYGELSVEEYLGFIADARKIGKAEREGRMDKAIEACGLGDFRKRRIETLSKGYRQRTGLAQAIMHDPSILILDEPTTGLDPNQIIEIRSLITELGKSKTVILSTHIMQEVEAMCSNVLILNEGRIAAQGTPAEISETLRGGNTWALTIKSTDALRAGVGAGLALPFNGASEGAITETNVNNVYNLTITMPRSENEADEMAQAEQISDWAVGKGYKILGMRQNRLSLEDIFVKLTGDDKEAGND
ncbi:MAG: ATP-binding cassette domain-containing protein [Spirochaetaceae bacterium]|jgi:ABC-2 type transport system ATP-binding protein|nr:ATP-binding cassette domain-containing protein [Spirochaetaceae bacterium]